MEFHPVANIFPLLQGQELEDLKADIAANGLIEPIWIHPDGRIIDGRNRWLACVETNTNADFRTYNGDLSTSALVRFVVSLNLKRRHLNSGQLAFVSLEIEKVLAEEAKERQRQQAVINSPFSSKVEFIPPLSEKGKARDQAAAIVGTNGRYVQDAKKLAAEAPEIADKVITGQLTMPKAKQELKEQVRKEELKQQRIDIEQGKMQLPIGVFEIIVIDPPWPYGTKYDAGGRRAANPYPEMTLEEISGIELPAAPDCILWLWTTHKFMRYSFSILDTWGFRDVAIVTWEKDRMGLGQWLRSNSEFCIMAVKGGPRVDLTNQKTVIHGPMREHSRKPDEFYNLVDSLCVGRKLDYFSREERPGWYTAGIEIKKFEADNDTF